MADDAGMQPIDPEQQTSDRAAQERFAAFAATAILLVAVLVLALWLWKPWQGSGGGSSGNAGGGFVIGAVADKELDTGFVAVWVKPGSDLLGVLSAADVSASGVLDLGEGAYLVATNGEDPAKLVEKLKKSSGLYDAGFVYRDASGQVSAPAPSTVASAPVAPIAPAPAPAASEPSAPPAADSAPPTGVSPVP